MRNRFAVGAVLALCLFALTGCLLTTKSGVIARSDGVSKKSGLIDVLGRPDEVTRLGPIETWTYNAIDGSVTFLITGSLVALRTTD